MRRYLHGGIATSNALEVASPAHFVQLVGAVFATDANATDTCATALLVGI